MGINWLSLCLKLGTVLAVMIQKSEGAIHSTHHIPLDLSELRGISKSDVSQNSEELKYLQEQLSLNQGNVQNSPIDIPIPNFGSDKFDFQVPHGSFQSKLGQEYQHILNQGLDSSKGAENFHGNKFQLTDFNFEGPPIPYDLSKGFNNHPNHKFQDYNSEQHQPQSPHPLQNGPVENYQQDHNQNLNEAPKKHTHTNSGGHVKFYFKSGQPNSGFKSQTYSSNAYYYENHKIKQPSAFNKRDGYNEKRGGSEEDESSDDYNSNKNGKKYKSYYSNKSNKPSYHSHQENGNKVQYNQNSPDANHGHVSHNNGHYQNHGPKQQYEVANGNGLNQGPNREHGNKNHHTSSHGTGHNQYGNQQSHSGPYHDTGNSNKNQSPGYGPGPNSGNGHKNGNKQHGYSQGGGYGNNNPDHNQDSHRPYQSHGNKQAPIDCSLCLGHGNSGPSPDHGSYNHEGTHGPESNHEQGNGHHQYHDGPPREENDERNQKAHVRWFSHGNFGNNRNLQWGKNKHDARPNQNASPHMGYSNKPQTAFSDNNGYRQHNTHNSNPGNVHRFNSQRPNAMSNQGPHQQRKSNPSSMHKMTEEKRTSRGKTKPVIHEIYMSHPLIKDNDVFLKGIP